MTETLINKMVQKMHGDNLRIRLDNMVASVYFHREIDIKELQNKFDSAFYDKKSFPALIIRFFDIGTTVLLFSSGKAVVTGLKNLTQLERTVNRIIEKISNGKDTPTPSVDIVNMVYTVEIGTPFNLDEIAFNLPNCEYDPEQFTGLVYRPRGMRAVLLVFASGNMVCSGARSEEDVREALRKFYTDVEKYNINIQVPEDLWGDEEW